MSRLVLGIESSCDETAASVVADGTRVLSNVIASQAQLHATYGGVVPELASRHHLENILPVVEQAVQQAGVTLDDLGAIAVTAGPGLVGTLLVGLSFAKALAFARGLPLIGVNHLHGHIYANFLTEGPGLPARDRTASQRGAEPDREAQDGPQFPLVCLVVSGGHTHLLYMTGHGQMELIGRTRDDAAGEAFDKAARVLGLGYPGGPKVEQMARGGNPAAVQLPRALQEERYDFSFSGLKTAVLQYQQRRGGSVPQAELPDLAASLQAAIVDVLVEKTARAAQARGVRQVLLAGGVAANGALRKAMVERLTPMGIRLFFPPPVLCTDNAMMIAAAGYFAWAAGQISDLELNATPGLGLAAVPVGAARR